MYRSRSFMFLLAMLLVLGIAVEAGATVYNWTGIEWSQSFRVTPLWKDSLNQSPASDAELDSLMSDASLGAEFRIGEDNKELSMRGRSATDGEIDATNMAITINAPFYYSADVNDGDRCMFFKDQWKSGTNTLTFNEMYFQGTMGIWDTDQGTLHIAGNIQVTGPAEIATSSEGNDPTYIDAYIDASRVDYFDIVWTKFSQKGSSDSLVHLTNSNNAFFGTWRLSARLYADADGVLGDSDVTVFGAGEVGTDPNVHGDDGRDRGTLVIGSSGAISPTAKLELTPVTYGTLLSKVVVNAGVNANVRQLIIDGTCIPAGTYGTANFPAAFPGRFEGAGIITVADVNATAIMTMECRNHLGVDIAGDTSLMPRVGTKGYKPGYAARIRAKSPMVISGAGYTFLKWQVNGADYSTDADTTVIMDTSKTVTAVYTKASGATLPSPANRAGAISVATGVSWTPDPAATVQSVYFGTSTAIYDSGASPVYTGNGSLSSLTNAELGGALKESTNYYWQVRSNVADDAKTHWLFTTGKVKAASPAPADGATGQATSVTLGWTPQDAGATSYIVYFGTDESAVENGLVTPTNVDVAELAKTGLSRGVRYYWRVDCQFPGKTAVGDVWTFRVDAVKIYLDTVALTATDESSNPLPGFTGAALDDGGVAVFKFDSFNYGLEYDVVVSGSNKLAIWSDNSMSFGGTLDVSAPLNDSQEPGTAKAGGYVGGAAGIMVNFSNYPDGHPAYQCFPLLRSTGAVRTITWYWLSGDANLYRANHYPDPNYGHAVPMTDAAQGPGRGYAQMNKEVATSTNMPNPKTDNTFGSGGTYGGSGGNSYSTNGKALGSSATAYANIPGALENLPGIYGQREVYELWGGSGGTGGAFPLTYSTNTALMYIPHVRARGGAGGGGAVEFFTKGNLTIGANAQILSNGGGTRNLYFGTVDGVSINNSVYMGGAGSGGSIRLVAAGNVTISGQLAADGGRGGDATAEKPTQSSIGSGGGGGRIAVYKGGTLNTAGAVVTAMGGPSGQYTGGTDAVYEWVSGRNGTVYGIQAGEGAVAMVTNAHFPIPADGTRGIAAGTANLTWVPGLGSTTNTVYFGTTTSPGLLTTVGGGRARKSASVSVVVNTKYYWRVDCDGVTGPLWTFRSTGYEAKNPTPANGAINATPSGLQLRWEDGYPDPNTITSREVFFGTDQIAVANATSGSPLKIATVTDKTKLFVNLPTLNTVTPYYWKVDTFATVTPNYIDGLVWNFTTRPPVCQGVLAGDFNNDCKINFVDFALLAANWKVCNLPDPLDCE